MCAASNASCALLNGICDEPVNYLKDKNRPMAVFEVLKKLKPM